jgi:predicted RNase H-like HicB family nuclease
MQEESRYPIIIYPAEEGGYVAEVPALKGCLAQGETQVECLKEIKKVQALWIESAKRITKKYPPLMKYSPNYGAWLRSYSTVLKVRSERFRRLG